MYSFVLSGWPWWIVVLLALAAAWTLVRIQVPEVAPQAPSRRRWLHGLRAVAAVLLVLPLLEPALAWHGGRDVPQRLAVIVDRSASMAATDEQAPATYRLDEAVALGLLPATARPDGPRLAAQRCRALAARLDGGQASDRADGHALRQAVAGIAGHGEIAAAMTALADRLDPPVRDGREVQPEPPADLAVQLRRLATRADAAQAASDGALVSGAEPDGQVRRALDALVRVPRSERARRLAAAATAGVSGVQWYALDTAIAQVDAGAPIMPGSAGTDLAAPLADLARAWGDGSGAVLLLSDGRQTVGSDPAGAAKALAARGVPVFAVAVGDPGRPRDAVVAELTGAGEVFRGETVRLEARIRIVDDVDRPWSLVFTRDGTEVERRIVHPTGGWEIERVERPAEVAGASVWRARLEPGAAGAPVRTGTGWRRAVWTPLTGGTLAALRPLLTSTPTEIGLVQADVRDDRPEYGDRISGVVVPPQTGLYTFWISSDDEGELRLDTGAGPTPIASVPGWTAPDAWDTYASQRSQPIALEAGRPYAIEALHAQATGGGHVIVGWQRPDGAIERPIPSDRLAPSAAPETTGSGAPADRTTTPEASLANNQAERTVTVVDDPIRALVVDHQPRWESRYVAALLERDRRVRADVRWATARRDGPLLPATQEDWDANEVVVLGDLGPGQLAVEDQARLRSFVGDRGGFLAVISGQRAMPSSFALGALADLLPVRPGPMATRPPATVALTADGQNHPVTAILGDRTLNNRLWPLLAPLTWWSPGATPKPGATVLLTAQGGHEPIAVLGRYGAGRVLWLGSDELWRWRDRLGDRVHQVFWLQALRWGLAGRLRGADPHLQIAVDPPEIEPRAGADVRIRLRGTTSPTPPEVTIVRLGDDGAPVTGSARTLAAVPTDVAGLWTAPTGTALGEGRWQVTVTAAGRREQRGLDVRRRSGLEGIELGADRAGLDRLAAAGGGRAVGPDGLATLIAELRTRLRPVHEDVHRTWSLWDGWWLAAAVAGVLSAGWILRRRSGLP